MGRKKKLRIPKSAMIKCPDCRKRTRLKIEENESQYFYECTKCKNKLNTPASQCCIVCAYTDKKCPPTLKREFKN